MKVVHRTHTQTCFGTQRLAVISPFGEPAWANGALGEVLICEASSPGARIKAQSGRKSCRGREVIRNAANGQFIARLAGETYTARFMILALGKKVSVEILQAASANKLRIVLQVGMCT
jgi:hypothetical protein